MQKVNTLDVIRDGKVLEAWNRLLKWLINEAEAPREEETSDAGLVDDVLAIYADYYKDAHDRVSAAEPVTSFEKFKIK